MKKAFRPVCFYHYFKNRMDTTRYDQFLSANDSYDPDAGRNKIVHFDTYSGQFQTSCSCSDTSHTIWGNSSHPVSILLMFRIYLVWQKEVTFLSSRIFVVNIKVRELMQIHQPLVHATQKGTVDESTDTWDTIDWLIKNTENNNGNGGIFGISYPGWLALVGSVDPHPALKLPRNKPAWEIFF
jgi:hypothetical protein